MRSILEKLNFTLEKAPSTNQIFVLTKFQCRQWLFYIYRLFTEISNPKTCYWTSKVIWKLPISVGVSMPPHLDEQRCVEPWTTSLQKWWLGNTTMKRWTFGHWECFAMNFYAENLHLKLLHIKQHIKGLWKLIYSFHLTFQQVSETNENS